MFERPTGRAPAALVAARALIQIKEGRAPAAYGRLGETAVAAMTTTGTEAFEHAYS
jgi:hypothetical protein